MRNKTAERRENIKALEHEAKISIATNELMSERNITPHVKVILPGVTADDLGKMHVASNTHENSIAAANVRHYGEKDATWEFARMKYSKIGNPTEIIRRVMDLTTKQLVTMLMSIDESKINKEDVQALEILASEITNEIRGKTMFPIHKPIEEIRPNSFTEKMTEENFDKASGAEMQKSFMCKGFVKPNEVFGKIKPRLIQHFQPEGSAGAALMNKTIESAISRLPYFVKRSIKGTDTFGTNQRLLDFILRYRSGGTASTDFGSFDSSITDKATGDMKKPGLRRIIEQRMMDSIAKAFPSSSDLSNTAGQRWQKKYSVQFDSFRLLTFVMIRCSGDGLTSVGNF